MKHLLISLIATLITLGVSINANAAQMTMPYNYTSQHIMQRDTAMLAFRSGKDILYTSYKNNDQELKNIMSFVANHANNLNNGLSHINVVSYIKSYDINNPRAVNIASIQASIVRAQFKIKYDIPHNAITFSIDTALNINNIVRVDYVNKPVKKYNNTNIYYTLKRDNIQLIRQEMAKYKPTVPYTNYIMRLVNENPAQALGLKAFKEGDLVVLNMGTTTETQPQFEVIVAENITENVEPTQKETQTPIQTPIQKTDKITDKQPVAIKEPTPQQKETEIKDNTKTNLTYTKTREKDLVGVKTNLLNWAIATPNIALEFYLGQNFSLEVEGSYTWAWFLNEKHKAYYKWDVGAEVKYWLKPGQFNGHAIGMHTTVGEYDIKLKADGIGKQGNYWALGVTYNYMMPIGTYFNIEFALGLGYAQYDVLKYQYNTDKNINTSIETKDKQNYFGPTKAKVALVWKF